MSNQELKLSIGQVRYIVGVRKVGCDNKNILHRVDIEV